MPDNLGLGLLRLWKNHGHYPTVATFVCPCGERLETGPGSERLKKLDVVTAAHKAVIEDGEWMREHKKHEGMKND